MTNRGKTNKTSGRTTPRSPSVSDEMSHFTWDVDKIEAAGESFLPIQEFAIQPRGGRHTNIAESRVEREGGPSKKDKSFRLRLYAKVGNVAVAGAHVEASMKRVLTVLDGRYDDLYAADGMWFKLHQAILQKCATIPDDPRASKLIELLERSENLDLRERRNTFVHGEWWLYEDDLLYLAKYHSGRSTLVTTSWAALDETITNCWEFVESLDKIVADEWHTVTLLPEDKKLPLDGVINVSIPLFMVRGPSD